VLNPHYALMGLHGSEYWTYTLPRRVGPGQAARLTTACLPVSPAAALRSGLVDQVLAGDPASFRARVRALAGQLAASPGYPARLAAKATQLAAAEHRKPLAAYRAAELDVMRRNFTGPREPYPRLRRAFVYKAKPAHTPPHLARHRTHPRPARPGQSPAPAPSALARQLGPRDGRLAARRADGREEQGAQTATPVPAATAAGP
jgi:putative two-component system hydrogenase maturation factor HypX/HoxX